MSSLGQNVRDYFTLPFEAEEENTIMRYGYFDDEAKEYVIDRPDTPQSWSNYLGSTEYGSIITNNAGGYSFYKSAAQGRLTRFRTGAIPMDQPGKYFYLRDKDSGDYWSATWQPVGKSLDDYKSICRHGTAYSTFESEYADIATEATYFVPKDQTFEYWMLKVKNNSDKKRELSVFSFCEFTTLWDTRNDLVNVQYSAYTVQCNWVEGMIRKAVTNNVPPNPDNFEDPDQGRWLFMGMCESEAVGWDTDRNKFIGPYRSYGNPQVVEDGKCLNTECYSDDACGTIQTDLVLEPGEEKDVVILLGIGKPEEEGKAIMAEYGSRERAEKELAALKEEWHGMLGRLVVDTPDESFNHMMNVWNPYNCLMTFLWSRTASLIYNGERDGLGYRDSVQDLMGVVPTLTDKVRERMELLLSGQCSTGGARDTVKPFAHYPGKMECPDLEKYRADDCLWFFNAIPYYVGETGDKDFYQKVVPYADKGEATVYGHLKRAIEFNLEHVGQHGLPSGLWADWNDCIRLGTGGESVYVTFQLRLALDVFAGIADDHGEEADAKWAREELAALDKRIQENCWDGDWFVRAFYEDGRPMGAKQCEEGKIFLNPQSWSIISGAATDKQAATAMQSVKKELATEWGIMACTPPFINEPYQVVRAVLLNPGNKENGGIFSQIQPWAVMAECMLGHGDQAHEYYSAFLPAAQNDKAEVREIEPYVHCQSTHSPHSKRYGTSRLPWLTGTAAWAYYAASAYMMGLRPSVEGLTIDPCVPSDWKTFKMERSFRGKRIKITVENPDGVQHGVKSLAFGGETIEGNFLPLGKIQDGMEVTLRMG